jgi:predicted DNA repair protein MutK
LHAKEDEQHKKERREALKQPGVDLRVLEREKIKGAIRTDFILSAEIIAITLGVVASASIGMQFAVLSVVAVGVTVVVYGLVAGIVKLDDLGLYLSQRNGELAQKVGDGILWLAPYLMKALSIVGTLAMFLVGGGILVHGVPPVYNAIELFAADYSGLWAMLIPVLANGLVGVVAGAVLVAVITPLIRLWEARSKTA